jgi:hypothetical protein
METGILVAFITGGFGILIALINRAKKENHNDHGKVATALGRIEGKLDTHMGDHRAHN